MCLNFSETLTNIVLLGGKNHFDIQKRQENKELAWISCKHFTDQTTKRAQEKQFSQQNRWQRSLSQATNIRYPQDLQHCAHAKSVLCTVLAKQEIGEEKMAVSQNLRNLFGVGYHPTIVFLKGFLGLHRGTRVLTHSQIHAERTPSESVF